MRGAAPDGAGSSGSSLPAGSQPTPAGQAKEAAAPAAPAPAPPAKQVPAKQATDASSPTTGKVTADGKVLYRRLTPFVLWWAWVAFAVFCLVDVVFPAHSYFSIEFVAGLLTVTAVVYACAVRPRVLADEESVVIQNPFRDHRVRWGAVQGVFLGDSVELSCARPAPKKDKSIYCWALYTARRPRMRAQMQRSLLKIGRSSTIPDKAADLRRADTVELMAAELGRRCKDARERGVPDAVLESRWAWQPLAGTLVLAAATLVLILVR